MPAKIKFAERDDGVELETQLLLRMPPEPAEVLRQSLREGGPNLKERFSVKLEHDLRYGEVRFDHYLMYAKLLDLPTITESLKTIDNKNFYKTADLCQMLLCKYEPDAPTTDDESPTKNKKKDPNKVDKKYLWPHGITPPCKNVRKRRFRKVLRKKNVEEAPEIEKEVKRLFRADNEAVNVKWDIVLDEEDPSRREILMGNDESTSQSTAAMDVAGPSEQDINREKPDKQKAIEDSLDVIPRDIDIFGEDLSSSDEEDNNINVDVDETSRLSADDSRSNFSSSMQGAGSMVTEFNKHMFNRSPSRLRQTSDSFDQPSSPHASASQFFEADEDSMPQLTQEEIQNKIADTRRQLNDLRDQRIAKEQEISSIENETLRQRMQDALDNILSQILEKEMEMQDYQSMQL